MNVVAYLEGYFYKEAQTGSARSFGASVGNATKKFMKGTLGADTADIDESIPHSPLTYQYETEEAIEKKKKLKHPARPDTAEAIEIAKQEKA